MQFNFDDKTENFLKLILKNAPKHNIRVFFVGGVVRDNLLGIENNDIDILIEGNAVEFCSNIPELTIKSVHKEFYTVKVLYDGLIFDIASTRVESYPHSGCLPVVKKVGVPIQEDVKRRDFTINSLYCELKLVSDNIEYILIDLVKGVNDLNKKVLRVLHANSYIDDPTRILRGVGFKYRFNVDFSDNDKILIDNYLKNIVRENMSISRIECVFKKIFALESGYDIFVEIIEKKYYKILFDYDLSFDYLIIENILNNLELNRDDISEFLFLLMKNPSQEKQEFNSLIELIKYFSKFNKENLAYYLYKTQDTKNVYKFIKAKDIHIFLNGNDLIQLGYKKGKIFSEIFNALIEYKLENPLKLLSKDDESEFVLKNFPKD